MQVGLLILAMVVGLSACTDATRYRMGAIGDAGRVKCYSGGNVIYEGKSTGKIEGSSGDGYVFVDAQTKELVRVTGDCIVHN